MELDEPQFQVAVFDPGLLLERTPSPRPSFSETPALAVSSTTVSITSIHNPDGVQHQSNPTSSQHLPHQTVLAKIENNDEGTLEWTPLELDSACLEAYSNTLLIYWSISVVVLAVYMIDRTKLVLCDKGVFQMNEAEDHLRYRGRNKKMEIGAWKLSVGLEDNTLEEAREYDEHPIALTLIEEKGEGEGDGL